MCWIVNKNNSSVNDVWTLSLIRLMEVPRYDSYYNGFLSSNNTNSSHNIAPGECDFHSILSKLAK